MWAESKIYTSTKKKTKKMRKKSFRLGSGYIKDTTDIETFNLSPLTQIFLDCQIGQNVTEKTPWILIDKEKILNHIDLYEESSEFYKIKDKIFRYPGTQIMVGSSNFNADVAVDFHICTTVQAQERVESFMKRKNELMMERVMNSVFRSIGQWISLGSEEHVKSEMICSNRVPLAVDIESDFPIHTNHTYFRIKRAEDILNGYVELPAGRPSELRFFWRRRVERGTQVMGCKKNKTVQTQDKTIRPQGTQSYHTGTVEMTLQITKELENFLRWEEKHMSDILNVNFHMNLYNNDYTDLTTNTRSMVIQKPVDIKLYQDVINCRRFKVSCLSWNSIIGGIVAASYSKNPLFSVSQCHPHAKDKDPIEEKHLILIWYYKDNVRPKLYLHAKAEVTALSFCPYDENILVAGYRNGLIAVWDLSDRLTDIETPNFLSEVEQQYHLLMSNYTEWFKRPLGFDHVFPAITSDYEIGHLSPVTSIVWVPPNYYISDLGHFTECENGQEHMQFLTITLEGNQILMWDLKSAEIQCAREKRRAKKCRLSFAPAALTKNVSPLKKLQKYFKPVLKLLVNESVMNENKNPLIKMILKNDLFEYVPLNPETLNNLDTLTYFNVEKPKFDSDMPRRLVFSTGLGVVQVAVWKGAPYKGLKKEEVCCVQTLAAVHDGPILVCEMNAFFPDMILTVGGSVFAIWDCAKSTNALVWRKSKDQYQSGMWCFHHPLSVLVIRTDRCYEFWDVSELSDRPLQIFRYAGYEMMKIFGDSTRFHARKKTFITTDALGAFKVFSLPSEVIINLEQKIQRAKMHLNRLFEFRKYIKVLKAKCRAKMETMQKSERRVRFQDRVSEAPLFIRPSEEIIPKKPIKISNKERFEKNLHRQMQFVQLKRKRINLDEINRNHILCLEEEKMKTYNKPVDEKALQEVCDKLFENIIISNTVQKLFTVTLSKEGVSNLKKRFLQSYRDMEQEVLAVIKAQNYSPMNEMIDRCEAMRKRNESIAHQEIMKLKVNVVVQTEANIIKEYHRYSRGGSIS